MVKGALLTLRLKAFSSNVSKLLPRLKGIEDDGKIAFTSQMCDIGGADMAHSALLLSYMFLGMLYDGLLLSKAATLTL